MNKIPLIAVLAIALATGAFAAEDRAAPGGPGDSLRAVPASDEPAVPGAVRGKTLAEGPGGFLTLTLASDSADVPGNPPPPAAPTAPAAPPAPPAPSGPIAGVNDAAVEAQLEAARKKLEAAAAEVAALSQKMSQPYIEQFMMDAEARRAIIGVQLDPAGKDGALVREVSPGGPAAEAGIRAGDVIVAVNGADVTGDHPARQVLRLVRDVKPDSKLSVRVLRDGKPRDFTITVRRVAGYMAWSAPAPEIPEFTWEGFPEVKSVTITHGAISNMELATLTPRLGRYFGTEKGVLVVRAPANGVLNLEDGDVILAIDGREPTSGSHATRILASYQPGEKIALRIMRDHKPQNIQASLPDRATQSEHRMERQSGLRERGEQSSRRAIVVQDGA